MSTAGEEGFSIGAYFSAGFAIIVVGASGFETGVNFDLYGGSECGEFLNGFGHERDACLALLCLPQHNNVHRQRKFED